MRSVHKLAVVALATVFGGAGLTPPSVRANKPPHRTDARVHAEVRRAVLRDGCWHLEVYCSLSNEGEETLSYQYLLPASDSAPPLALTPPPGALRSEQVPDSLFGITCPSVVPDPAFVPPLVATPPPAVAPPPAAPPIDDHALGAGSRRVAVTIPPGNSASFRLIVTQQDKEIATRFGMRVLVGGRPHIVMSPTIHFPGISGRSHIVGEEVRPAPCPHDAPMESRDF